MSCNGKLFEGLLLVSDMDGTLLDDKSNLSDKNISALDYFVENGGLFTLATGRGLGTTAGFADLLPVNVPAILGNGAMIYDFADKKVLAEEHLDEAAKELIRVVLEKISDVGIEIFGGNEIFTVNVNEVTEMHRKRDRFSQNKRLIDEVPEPWYKILFADTPERLKRVGSILEEYSDMYSIVFSERHFLEVFKKDISKGEALKKLSDMLDIPVGNIITMGDNMNDMEMICFAGTGIAVGNAHPELKRAADLCCCRNDENAVQQVVEWIGSRSADFAFGAQT